MGLQIINPSKEISRIVSFILDYVKGSGAKGVVVGLSGGIDSSVVAALCVRALGRSRVLGVYLFEEEDEKDAPINRDFKDARAVAAKLGMKTVKIAISPILSPIEKSLRSTLRKGEISRITIANVKARIRMVLLYAIANQRKLLVAGTGDRSEILVGYFTKYGDGAADILPIAHLYKTEVREVAREMSLPAEIVSKPSSPNLWKGQRAVDELPADYDELDKILPILYDAKIKPGKVSRLLKISPVPVKKTIEMNSKSKHKRTLPASLERQEKRRGAPR